MSLNLNKLLLLITTIVCFPCLSQEYCLSSPSYVSEWRTITAQDIVNSELTFEHGFGEYPIKVNAEIKAIIGSEEYIFQGYGSSHKDDDSSDTYGGVVYVYNDIEIKVFAPNANNQFDSGKAFYTGNSARWLGPGYATHLSVHVRVLAWKENDLPIPLFRSHWYHLDTKNASLTFHEIPHNLESCPDFTVVHVRGLHNYIAEAQGMSNVVQNSNIKSTLGVIYGYSTSVFRVWTPLSSTEDPSNNDCSTKSKYDVIFVVDESGSVGADNFVKTKDAIKKVLVSFDIDSGLIRVGILCYSSSNRVIFHLQEHDSDLASALTAVDNIVYQRGGTMIASAMKKARQDMFVSNKGDRSDASNIMVVMTDGKSYDDYSEEQEADLCRAAGIKVASVAIGTNLDEAMLRSIAYSDSWYLQTDFDSLGNDFVTLMEALGPCPSGGIIGAYDGWGNNTGLASTSGEFRIYAWKYPISEKVYHQSFHLNDLNDQTQSIHFDLSLNTDEFIVMAEIAAQDGANSGFRFQGIGSVMHEGMDGSQYGGFVYGYNSTDFVYWTPTSQTSAILNIGDAWGTGIMSQSSNNVDIIISVYKISANETTCFLADLQTPFSSVHITNYRVGGTAVSSCDEGYYIVGGDTIRTCNDSGYWTGQQIQCDQVPECSLGEASAPHTVVNITSLKNGGAAFSSCIEGYTMVSGDSIRTCNESGQWSGESLTCSKDPECTNSDVSAPHSTVNITGYTSGGVAFSKCNDGYRIEGGDEFRICGEDGHWSGQRIQCSKNPECIHNDVSAPYSTVNVTAYTSGGVAFSKCYEGYRIEGGDEFRICGDDGYWSGQKIQCSIVPACSHNDVTAPNSKVEVTGYTNGSVAISSCFHGYRVEGGDAVRICDENGHWSGDKVQCSKVPECTSNEVSAPNSIVNITGYTEGGVAVSSCIEGFRIERGDTIRVCDKDGKWSGTKIECVEADPGCDTSVTFKDIRTEQLQTCLSYNTIMKGDLNSTCSDDRLQDNNCSACFLQCPPAADPNSEQLSRISRKSTALFRRSLESTDNRDTSATVLGVAIISIPVSIVLALTVIDFIKIIPAIWPKL